MTLRLTVHRAAWLHHVRATALAYGDALVPVVKGNGYGFGRAVLHELVASLPASPASPASPANPDRPPLPASPDGPTGHTVCVGTVHELADVPAGLEPVVLTPALAPPSWRTDAVLTVGSVAQVEALRGWRGRVIVKLASSMRRYGATPGELPAVLTAATHGGLDVIAYGLHLPLAGTDDDRLAEVAAWRGALPADGVPLWLSHLAPSTVRSLRATVADRPMRIRVGTALWHGLPRGPFLHLGAEVLHTRPVRAGDVAGYRHTAVPCDGTLVAVGCGSAHGVAPLAHELAERRSPFHFARTRLHLLEPPHMHTSLCVVPAGQPCPTVGELVDVQQPLINVHPDQVEWQP